MEYEDLTFERIVEYDLTVSKEHAEDIGLPAIEFEARVVIEPEVEKPYSIKQRGKIHIFLPGRQETKDLAYLMANAIANQITFSQGKMDIDWSFVGNELLPEALEEAEKLGENRFGYTMKVEEMLDKVPFNSASLQNLISNPLIEQFNIANSSPNPIDSFIGLFKILEDLYGSTPLKPAFIKPTKKKGNNKKQELKPSLKSSDELNQIILDNISMNQNGVTRPISQTEIEKLIDKLVDTRHECAHLRSSKGFGITHSDYRVKTEVEPLLESLRALVYDAVQKHIAKI